MLEIIQEHFLIVMIVVLFILFVIIGFLVDRMKRKDNYFTPSNEEAPTIVQEVSEEETPPMPEQTITEAVAKIDASPEAALVQAEAPVQKEVVKEPEPAPVVEKSKKKAKPEPTPAQEVNLDIPEVE